VRSKALPRYAEASQAGPLILLALAGSIPGLTICRQSRKVFTIMNAFVGLGICLGLVFLMVLPGLIMYWMGVGK
jgi:hypothetical protein